MSVGLPGRNRGSSRSRLARAAGSGPARPLRPGMTRIPATGAAGPRLTSSDPR